MRSTRARRIGSLAVLGLALVPALVLAAPSSCTIFSGVVFHGGKGGDGAGGSGSGGGGGAPPASVHYLSMADAARFCTRLAECPEPQLYQSALNTTGVPADANNYSLCMTWAAGRIPEDRIGVAYQRSVLQCMAKAGSCIEAGACAAHEIFPPNDPRCTGFDGGAAGAPAEGCEDPDTVIRCDNGGDELHCNNAYFPGASCMLDQDGSRWCATATNCNIQSTCVGTVLEYCGFQSVLQFNIDCSTLGLTCGEDSKHVLECLTDGKHRGCGQYNSTCDGDTVIVCNSEYYSPFHCDALGGTCDPALGTAYCKRADDACTPFDGDVNVCSGSKIALCVGGSRAEFDCVSIGKTCASAPTPGCH